MIFRLIDRIEDYEKGKSIKAVKTLSLCEDYLADHFPAFPIMPGALMLETMVQAAAWLMRLSDGFEHSAYILKSARAIRYGSVVRPGEELRVEILLRGREGAETSFSGNGRVGDRNAVTGRFTLARKPLMELNPALEEIDGRITGYFESQIPALLECERKI